MPIFRGDSHVIDIDLHSLGTVPERVKLIMNSFHIPLILLLALIISLWSLPVIIRWAIIIGAVDTPNSRKVHRNAVPRIGGVAIFAAWIIPVLLTTDMSRETWGIMAGAFIMFITGLIDDIYDISAVCKLACQIFASLVTMFFGGFYIKVLYNFPGITTVTLPSLLIVPITIIFVVSIINAFNMIDGLDGLAAGIGVITLTTFAILAYLSDNYLILPLTIALIGGIIGFLKYNFHPARIFMGDSGSLLIGFIIAFLAISLTQSPQTTVRPVIPLLILGLPITDLLFVSAKRAFNGKNPFAADRTHLHHKFLDIGFQHSFTVLIIYSISLVLSISSLLYYRFNEPILLIFCTLILFVLYRILCFKLVSTKANSLDLGKSY